MQSTIRGRIEARRNEYRAEKIKHNSLLTFRYNNTMLFLILLLGIILRLYGINWDLGWHLHPDERMLIMVAEKIHFFTNLNPDFFNYGTLPIYILKGAAQIIDIFSKTPVSTYEGLLTVGRGISVIVDVTTILMLYKIARLLFKKKSPALLAALFYTIAFFPIHNSHFFVVDVFLTFFTTCIVYLLLLYIKKQHIQTAVLLGIMHAAAVTTKATGLIFLVPIGLTLAFRMIRPLKLKRLSISAGHILIYLFFLGICSYIFMPYAFNNQVTIWQIIENPATNRLMNPQLVQDVKLQMKMSSDPFIFPYTLQYVGTIPYLYYLKNIVLFGLGPIIALFTLLGITRMILVPFKKGKSRSLVKELFKPAKRLHIFFLLFYLFYFILIGRSAVKFMRYMLPLYPAFAILAGYGIDRIIRKFVKVKRKRFKMTTALIMICAIWTLMFMRIYSKEHTRITASKWIYTNIPPGSSLGVEHWDDRLPLPTQVGYGYKFVDLPLYDAESPLKWTTIQTNLSQADYIIVASNRLYTPLTKLTDCKSLPTGRCYPDTAAYYKTLFEGTGGFTKVKEFSSYPGFSLGSYSFDIVDDFADESFTVYDHPKIMIFKKN